VQLLKLRVYHYRNLEQQEIHFSSGTNLFSGLNGQGKTNLLEAIYILGYGRSFRTAKPKECIRHGEVECAVEGAVQHRGSSRNLIVLINSNEKELLVYGKPVQLDEFVGLFHVVVFSGAHLSIVRGGPGERRSFLDRAMVTIFPGHLRLLATYGRALKQRNRIMAAAKEISGGLDESLLDSWDEMLVREGSRIVLNRQRYVQRLKAEVQTGLFGAEVLKIHYLSTVPDQHSSEEIEARFRERLQAVRAADQKSGFTSVGPHRDDLKLYADGKALADFGSAGQQRSCLLALYFAQMEIHMKEHGFYPVFLVDDVEAELDDHRLRTFLGYLSDRTQTFLTTAKEALVPTLPGPIHRYEVKAGTVVPCS
jgi:DNA replication and repair protein RecF